MKKRFFLRFLSLLMLCLLGLGSAEAYTGSYTCANATGGSLATSSSVAGSSLSWSYSGATWSKPQTRFSANGTITFSIVGIKVTEIEMGFSSDAYVGSWTATTGSFSTNGTSVTWTGEATGTLTFTTSSAARLKTIDFTYSENISGYVLTYDANGGSGTMVDDNSPYEGGSTVTVADNAFTRTGHTFSGWNTAADGSGTSYSPGDTFTIVEDVTLYAQWKERSEIFTIFHEGFGNNTDKLRDWNDGYKEQNGVASVYADAEYTMVNAKQTTNTMGSVKSGLSQVSSGSPALFIVGPLDLASYGDITLSYQWRAGSIKGTYYTKVYYATSSAGEYTEIPNTAVGATGYSDVTVSVPEAALVSTAYFKVEFSTSNTQAVIDEFDLTGKTAKATPNAYFDLPVHFVYADDEIDLPEHVSASTGAVTHVSADTDIAAIDHNAAVVRGGASHGTSTVVTATIAETDYHASATASYIVKVVPATVTVSLGQRYTPFAHEYNLDFSGVEGVKAYAVTKFETADNLGQTCAIIEEISGQTVPSRNGIILEGDAGEYEVPVLVGVGQIEEENYLVGVLKGEDIPNSDDVFSRFTYDTASWNYLRLPKSSASPVSNSETAASPVIGSKAASASASPVSNSETAASPVIGSKTSVKAATADDNTAYVEVPADMGATLPDVLPLGFVDGGAVTGVEEVAIDTEDLDAVYYNLQGVPMTTDNLTPGIYIKVKGRHATKVYVK